MNDITEKLETEAVPAEGVIESSAEADTVTEAVTEAVTENAAETPTEIISDVSDDKKKKRRRKKKDEFDVTKDIKYRGPLSYRHLKLLGWICIVISQIAVVENLKARFIGTANEFFLDDSVINSISSLSLPLLLLSVFAFLLKKRDNYKSTIIVYGGLSLAVAGLFLFVYERYIVGIILPLSGGDREKAITAFAEGLRESGDFKGFLPFNIFIDLFICTLIMFFLDYTPRKFFTGKKLMIFRALVIIPLAYEVACLVLKIGATDRIIDLPVWVSPFLTTKPPMSILMFLSIVRYIKIREEKFYQSGRTPAQFKEYVLTNKNSFQYSRHLVVIIIVYSALDILLFIFLSSFHFVIMGGQLDSPTRAQDIASALTAVYNWGFFGTSQMILLLPIVLLFSYTRSHKLPFIDTAIPIAGVVAIVIVYIDGLFQILQNSIGQIVEVISQSMLT